MIHEEYISSKQAEDLKKLGFPFVEADNLKFTNFPIGYLSVNTINGKEYLIPSYSLVQKWLREEKDIILIPIATLSWNYNNEQYYNPHYECCYTQWNSPLLSRVLSNTKEGFNNYKPAEFLTYEQALSAGIDKAIKILKEKENVGS